MAKKISHAKAAMLKQKEIESQELNKQGIQPKISRQEKKRLMRMSKTERFVEMLKKRGGYYSDKPEAEKGEKKIQEKVKYV